MIVRERAPTLIFGRAYNSTLQVTGLLRDNLLVLVMILLPISLFYLKQLLVYMKNSEYPIEVHIAALIAKGAVALCHFG